MSAVAASSKADLPRGAGNGSGGSTNAQESVESYNKLLRASTGSRVILSRAQRLKMKEHYERLQAERRRETKEASEPKKSLPPPPSPLIRPSHYPPLYRPPSSSTNWKAQNNSPYRSPGRKPMAQAPTPSRPGKRTRTGLSPALRAMEVSSPNVRQTRARYGKHLPTTRPLPFSISSTSPLKSPRAHADSSPPPLSLGGAPATPTQLTRRTSIDSITSIGSLNSPRVIQGGSIFDEEQQSFLSNGIIGPSDDAPNPYMEDEDLGDSSIMPLGMVDEADPSVLDDNSVAEQAIQSIIDDSNRRGNNAEDGEENDRGNSKEMRWSFRDASFSFDGEGSLGVEPQLQEQDDACEGKEPVPFLFRRTSVESLKLDDDEEEGEDSSFSVSPMVKSSSSALFRAMSDSEFGDFNL